MTNESLQWDIDKKIILALMFYSILLSTLCSTYSHKLIQLAEPERETPVASKSKIMASTIVSDDVSFLKKKDKKETRIKIF